jgi:translation initiation factor IF-3
MSKKRPYPGSEKGKDTTRINRDIKSSRVRLVTEGSAEIVSLQDALRMAEEQGLDLVEISPDQDPPVCKLINFGKWKFEQQKKKKEQSRHQHVIHIKEIKLRPKIGVHDYEIKKEQAADFLQKGDKVKVTLRFRGREIAHPELGAVILEKLTEDLKETGVVEAPPKMEGRQIVMVVAPKATPTKKKNDVPPQKKEVVRNQGSENSGPSGEGRVAESISAQP